MPFPLLTVPLETHCENRGILVHRYLSSLGALYVSHTWIKLLQKLLILQDSCSSSCFLFFCFVLVQYCA